MSTPTILHLTGMGSSKLGGLERYFLALIRRCNQSGYRTVLQYETLPRSAEYLQSLRELGAEVVTLGTQVTMLETVRRVAHLIRTYRPETVQTHFVGPWVHLVTPTIARQLGTQRTVALIHSATFLRRLSPRRFGLAGFDHVLGVSEAITAELLGAGLPRNVATTHRLGLLDSEEGSAALRARFRQELGLVEPAVVLGCIGFDAEVKGLDLLLGAVARLAPQRPSLQLVLVGVDPARSELPRLAERLGLADRVRWPGIQDCAYRLLNAADLYVQPSRSEGIPLAVMEAMALRLPVVATRVGGLPEAVVDGVTGHLAAEPTVEAVAAALEKALSRSAEWHVQGDAGRARFELLFRGEASVETLAQRYLCAAAACSPGPGVLPGPERIAH